MPSKKKAKAKGWKAAKEAKAKTSEEESRAMTEVVEVADSQRQEGTLELEAQLQRLLISSDDTPQQCEHGLVQISDGDQICLELINVFLAAFTSEEDASLGFYVAQDVTRTKFPTIYESKLDTVASIFIARGTQFILEDKEDKRSAARLYASSACYFENLNALSSNISKVSPNVSKVFELLDADDHTLVSFYRNRIPCACLDQKYKEVKSVKKIGRCCNLNCSHPGRKVDRSKMLSCTRCCDANYCSVECQKADWKRHKLACCATALVKAAFSSSQTDEDEIVALYRQFCDGAVEAKAALLDSSQT